MTNKDNEIKRHEIYRQAAEYCYDEKNRKLPEGYSLIDSVHTKNGLDASILKNDNDIIIAYQGTQSKNDYIDDVKIYYGNISKQCKEGRELYKEVKKMYPDLEITTTGHSLGGAISQYVSAVEWCKSVNFNPLGAREVLMNNIEAFDTTGIVNYCNPRDWVSSANAEKQLGVCYEVTSKGFTSKKEAGLKAHHDIESMEDLRSRKLISREELHEKYNNYAHQGTEHHVSGYTRDDGTNVKSYTRGCGPNHVHK